MHAANTRVSQSISEASITFILTLFLAAFMKWTVAQDFRPSVFFINQPHLGPCSGPKDVLHMASYSQRKLTILEFQRGE
jgi:hypothetical protein